MGLDERPDLCIVNTCSVTSRSDYESRQLIRRAHRAGSSIIVTGCYAQLNKDKVKAMEGVRAVVDNAEKDFILNMITELPSSSSLRVCPSARSRLFLKIQDGCDRSCSYCVIPRARGRSRSVPIEEIVRQVDALSDEYSEVVLTGIHVGTYGYDLYPKVIISDLVRSILMRTSIKRVRLSSLEVGELTDHLIEVVQDERVCPHLHVPLQSGDDRILKLMRRGYDSRRFLAGLERILARIPEIALGTDIIVGFPGERDEEFRNTRTLVERIPFSYLHVFPFSKREGTLAAQMPGTIDSATMKRRCSLLRSLGRTKRMDYMQRQVGRTLDLLIEEKDDSGESLGTTGNYLKVRAPNLEAPLKDIVPVRIAGVDREVLVGHLITKQ